MPARKKKNSPENKAEELSVSSLAKEIQLKEILKHIQGLEGEIGDVVRLMKEKVRQLECLTEFSSLLNSSLDTEKVREKALQATCELIHCETASLFLIDEKKSELYWETALGDVGKELQKTVRLPINDQSIAGFVAMTGEGLLVNDVANDHRHSVDAKRKSKKKGFETITMICVPLKNKEKTIGVLQAINKLASVPPKPSKHSWPDFQEDDLKMLSSLAHQVSVAIENSHLYSRLKKSFYDTVEALAESIEKKDQYTGGHTKRVVLYSVAIAKHVGELSKEEQERIRLGAILHDVGKIGIEDKILKKAAPLDKDEWPIMKTHPELGYQIMKRVEGLQDVIGAMKHHHERWDGRGYPDGLKGEEIPLIARIIAVADTYDAMVSTRPYRKGLKPQIAYDEIVKHAGSQFCPRVVEAFKLAYHQDKMGKRNR